MSELYGWSIDLLNCCFNEARQYVTREVKRSGKERLHEVKWANFFIIFFKGSFSIMCEMCCWKGPEVNWKKGIKGIIYAASPEITPLLLGLFMIFTDLNALFQWKASFFFG